MLGLPVWAAAILAVVLFGLGHRYQGLRGIITTGGAAVVFTALYALTGNLIVPIALHVTIDLVSLLLVPALLARHAAPVTATEPATAPATERRPGRHGDGGGRIMTACSIGSTPASTSRAPA